MSTAITQCSSLGAGYALISNAQWQTIAQNIENVATNWSGGAVGTGGIPRGHSDGTPTWPVAVTDLNDPYNQTANNSGEAYGSG